MKANKTAKTVGLGSKSDKPARKTPKGKLAGHPAFQELDRMLKAGQLDPDSTAAFLKSDPTPKDRAMNDSAQVNIRVAPDLRRALKIESARRGIPVQDLITLYILTAADFKARRRENPDPALEAWALAKYGDAVKV